MREVAHQYVSALNFCCFFCLTWLLAGFRHCASSKWFFLTQGKCRHAERHRIPGKPKGFAEKTLPANFQGGGSMMQGKQDQAHHGTTGELGTIDPLEMFSKGSEPFGWRQYDGRVLWRCGQQRMSSDLRFYVDEGSISISCVMPVAFSKTRSFKWLDRSKIEQRKALFNPLDKFVITLSKCLRLHRETFQFPEMGWNANRFRIKL